MINYQQIIENLRIEDVKLLLSKLEIPYIDKEEYILCKTACHNEDLDEASWKLYFYKDTKLFVCYTECGAQSIFKFLEHYYKVRQIEYDWYEDIYNAIVNCSNFKEKENNVNKYSSIRDNFHATKTLELPEFDPNVLQSFSIYYPIEWLNEGISKKTMKKFGIRYSISQNKIIIPHYDVNNRLVGIRGRALDAWEVENIGKYAPVKVENIWYKHKLGLNLYGLNYNKNNIKKQKICYICESEKAVLQCESFNMPNCAVAVCGSNINKFVLRILMKECMPQEIVVCFDKEEKPGEEKYFFKLWNLCKKYNNICNFSFIYDRSNLLKMKDSPTDRGEEIFKELLKKRVVVK